MLLFARGSGNWNSRYIVLDPTFIKIFKSKSVGFVHTAIRSFVLIFFHPSILSSFLVCLAVEATQRRSTLARLHRANSGWLFPLLNQIRHFTPSSSAKLIASRKPLSSSFHW